MCENIENVIDEQVEDSFETEVESHEKADDSVLEKELKDTKDKYLRILAEYDNFRKRTQREKEASYVDIKARSLSDMLPVLDNLERAVKTETADTAYAQGVEMIAKQFVEVMAKNGIVEIPALNCQFDPNFHNAVMHVEDDTVGANVIVEVFQKGYKMGEDKVLRHAIVRVAN